MNLTRHHLQGIAWASLACGLFTWVAFAAGPGVDSGPQAALQRYGTATGESLFALGLRPAPLATAAPAPHDILILVDTSASQTGEHRVQQLQVVKGLFASFRDTDRVCLMAADVQAEALTTGFIAPRGADADAAIAKLQRRLPLGATNLETALRSAIDTFPGANPQAVIYVGDGMSTANLIQTGAMQTLVRDLRDAQTPVHSYAVGPRTDLMLVGLLAEHTGGIVIADEPNQIVNRGTALPDSVRVAEELAAAAIAPVFYPSRIEMTPPASRLLPEGNLPPLRADRDTYLLGSGVLSGDVRIVVEGQCGGADQTLSFEVAAPAEQPGNTYLATLWEQAVRDQGLSLPLAGTNMLNLARDSHERQIAAVLALGQDALAANDADTAERFARQVRRVDPGNADAGVILALVDNMRRGTRVRPAAFRQPAPPDPADDTNDAAAPPIPADEQSLIQEEEERRERRAQFITSEVNAAIETSRRNSDVDPDAVLEILKRQLSTVIEAFDIDPVVRETLRRRLEGERLLVESRREAVQASLVDAQRRQAVVEQQRRLTDQMQLDEERLELLIDRVRTALAEGERGNQDAFEEAESVARAVISIQPRSIEGTAALFNSEAAGQLDKARRLRALRADKFLETLYQVELSHVPFPDEPPVLWPAPEVWQALTERRKQWKSVDLRRYNKNEERIRTALDEPTEVEFIDLPLREAISFLKDFHNIPIIVNEVALQDEGTATDTTVNLSVSGISLRSALKLLLEPLQLSYIIQDEVMQITTKVDANNPQRNVVRVYPVGDLVIPANTMSLGSGVGGFSGGGGQGGGFGANPFGGGFGGGQMGGGMGGMGQFNVPPEKVPAAGQPAAKPAAAQADQFNRNAIRNAKKKP